MISLRHLLALILTGAFLVSCAPYPPEGPFNPNPATAEKVVPEVTKKQSEVERQKEENRKRLAAKKRAEAKKRAADRAADREAEGSREVTTPKPPEVKPKSKYPTASRTRPGFVKNPYTGAEVDVRGVPGGSLVIDPDDPNKATNKFRIP
ncbi:MAG: hypothetical protein ACSHYF_16255 [Verrucomicrobiaceae bacterium]